MGFIATTPGNTPRVTLFLLDVVTNVMRSLGMPGPSDLSQPVDRVAMCMNAVDVASQRIWEAARWDWRSRWVPLEIGVGELPCVALPADFGEPGANPQCQFLENPLEPIGFEELVLYKPEYLSLPTYSYASITDLSEQLVEFTTNEENLGVPRYWAIHGSNILWFPILDQDSLDLMGEGDLTKMTAFFNYYARYESVLGTAFSTDINPTVQIPQELLHVLHHLTVGYLGHDLEFPGAQRNETRGEQLLQACVARRRKDKRDNAQFTTGNTRRAW